MRKYPLVLPQTNEIRISVGGNTCFFKAPQEVLICSQECELQNYLFVRKFNTPNSFVKGTINQFFFFFLAALGLSLPRAGFLQLRQAGATLCCGARASHCGGFSCCGARALGTRASVVVARRPQSSRASVVIVCGLSSCGARAQLLCSMWDLPGPGIEPLSPALAGGFSTIAPPGKSQISFKKNKFFYKLSVCANICLLVTLKERHF